jgi:hypothetical protein
MEAKKSWYPRAQTHSSESILSICPYVRLPSEIHADLKKPQKTCISITEMPKCRLLAASMHVRGSIDQDFILTLNGSKLLNAPYH